MTSLRCSEGGTGVSPVNSAATKTGITGETPVPRSARCLLAFLIVAAFFVACDKPAPAEGNSTSPQSLPAFGWRGDGTGDFPDAAPPTTWSRDRHVVWRTELASWSNASPALAGDRVFVCAEPFILLCLRASDGVILWQKTNAYLDLLTPEKAAEAEAMRKAAEPIRAEMRKAEQSLRRHKDATKDAPDDPANIAKRAELEAQIAQLREQLVPLSEYESPRTESGVVGYTTATPTTDGRRVFAFFGNGIAACYDLDGNRVWARLVEKPTADYGHSSSPLLAGGKLLVFVNALHALDAATGAPVWKATAKHHWGSPVLARAAGEEIAVMPGGESIRIADGAVLATKGAGVSEASPVALGDRIFGIDPEAQAVRLARTAPDKLKRDVLWKARLPGPRYFASPVIRDGLAFTVSEAGDFTILDAATGALVQTRKLDNAKKARFFSSLSSAGGKIFVTSDDGITRVLNADREARQLAENALEPIRSSLVFSRKRLYARTLKALWCIEE